MLITLFGASREACLIRPCLPDTEVPDDVRGTGEVPDAVQERTTMRTLSRKTTMKRGHQHETTPSTSALYLHDL